MTNYLIIYSSIDGHTKAICERIFSKLIKNNNINITSLSNAENLDLSPYDFFIIGASIRYGKHRLGLYNFIKKNIKYLKPVKCAFFSVNVVARKIDKNKPETNPYMKKFLKITNWKPKNLEVFAGKIDYPKYKFFDKNIIRFIMWITGGPTNVKKTYDFTDWKSVDKFCVKLGHK